MKKRIYTPEPDSIQYRILNFFQRNPNEELTRSDIAVKFEIQPSFVDEALSIAKIYGAVVTTRNEETELVWRLGRENSFSLQ